MGAQMKGLNLLISIVLTIIIGFVSCEISTDLDINTIEKSLQEHNIPGLENFNSSKLPSTEDIEKVLKEKCEKNGGGEEAVNALKNQQTALKDCLERHLNVTQIQSEVEEAKKTGSMDEVFGKYCRKYPEIYECVSTVTETIRPCLDGNEQQTLNQTLHIVGELKEFVCHKDGDRIAMFVAEGGIECLESKKESLQDCANKTIGSRIPTDVSVNNLPTFLFNERNCKDFDDIRSCVNTELEKCKDSTPANIVDAFFKFLKKNMPCEASSYEGTKVGKSLLKNQGGTSSSNSVHVAATVFVILTFVSVRLF